VIRITSTTPIPAWRAGILLAARRGILALVRHQDGQAAGCSFARHAGATRGKIATARTSSAVVPSGLKAAKKCDVRFWLDR
jgi:hypothetical protein